MEWISDNLPLVMPALLLVGGGVGWLLRRALTDAKNREEAQHVSVIAQTIAQMKASNVTTEDIEEFRRFIGRNRQRSERRPDTLVSETMEERHIGENETQADMNEAAARELAERDAELHSIIDQLARDLSAEEFARLKEAQEKWAAFRDAHAGFVGDLFAGGSMQPLWYITAVMSATNDRIDELRAYLEAREMGS